MNEPLLLIDRYLDGVLTPAETQALFAWVRQDADHARLMFKRVYLHCRTRDVLRRMDMQKLFASGDEASEGVFADADVMEEVVRQARLSAARAHETRDNTSNIASQTADDHPWARVDVDSDAPAVRHIVIPRFIVYGAVAALLALTALLWLNWPATPEPPTPVPVPTLAVVGTLVSESGAQWKGASQALTVGGPVHNEPIQLIQGVALLRLASGAEIILQAPCSIEPIAHDMMRLHDGTIVGRCDTPASRGFTVLVGEIRVTDLGTEFGITHQPDHESQVHVFDGEVAILPAGRGAEQMVRANEAARINASGDRIESIDVNTSGFVRAVDTRDAIQRYVDIVRSDAPIAYWRFESIAGGLVGNEMSHRYRAQVVGGAKLRQDTATNRYLHLSAPSAFAVVEPLPPLHGATDYTVECWIKPASQEYGAVFSLLAETAPDETPAFVAHLEVNTGSTSPTSGPPSRSLRFIHRNPPSHDWGQGTELAFPYVVGRWHHVVVTKSGDQLLMYIDGQVVDQAVDATALTVDTIGLWIGRYEPRDGLSRQFAGSIDEVAIYDHALSPEAVSRHHTAMKRSFLSSP